MPVAQAAKIDIIGSGHNYAVRVDGRPLARRFTSTGNAIAALPGIERGLRPITTRRCLCCGTPFTSAGPMNRLCTPCQKEA